MQSYFSLSFKHYLLIYLIVFMALSIYLVQHQIVGYKGREQKIEEFMTLPKGEYLKDRKREQATFLDQY